MDAGAPVDIVSGEPFAPDQGMGRNRGNEADSLVEKMRLAGLPDTEAAERVALCVTKILEELIDGFLRKNPRAQVCVEILREINAPALTAREAAKRYVTQAGRRPSYRP